MELRCSKDKELEELRLEIQKMQTDAQHQMAVLKKKQHDADFEREKAKLAQDVAKKLKEEADDIKSKIQLELQMVQARQAALNNRGTEIDKKVSDANKIIDENRKAKVRLEKNVEAAVANKKNLDKLMTEARQEKLKFQKTNDEIRKDLVDLTERKKKYEAWEKDIETDFTNNKKDAESNRAELKRLKILAKKLKVRI